jgi:hypothetical protein
MSEAPDTIRDKIRKLLAKANNTACTVEEAKSFNEKANELMAKYNLDRAAVADKEESIIRTHRELQVLNRPWSSAILHGLCHVYYCKWYFTRLNSRRDTITIVGEENNVAVCHAIAIMVLRAVQQEARRTGDGRSFMTGAAHAIHQRCYEMRPQTSIASAVGTGKSLMVLGDSEDRGNADYIAAKVGTLRPAKKSAARISSAVGFDRGSKFGNTVHLRGNLLGGR